MPEFDKWWNDSKKHQKRLNHWLPHWKDLAGRVGGARGLRYFTLCAKSMIDVFMLVNEGLLDFDEENHSIGSVNFCECDPKQFVEIREMIATEGAGFLGFLQEVALFEDDDFTAQFPTLESIAQKLEDERLQEDYELIDRLQLKRTFLNFKSSFPYDNVNLDFCDYYYQKPPGMLDINKTVERFLKWQLRPTEDEEKVKIEDFVLAVTCRHDDQFPVQAEARLVELIRENCSNSDEYKIEIERSRGVIEIEKWAQNAKEDFFFAGWPKDIARAAKDHGWKTEILDLVYYRRIDSKKIPYVIVCLVARFSRANSLPDYMPAALHVLDEGNRTIIEEIDPNSDEGKRLRADLTGVVAVRNAQARRKQRTELPDP